LRGIERFGVAALRRPAFTALPPAFERRFIAFALGPDMASWRVKLKDLRGDRERDGRATGGGK
jgi:hypothetical protein